MMRENLLTKSDVLRVADEFLALAAERNVESAAGSIREQLVEYKAGVFRLAVVGEAKRGKSSFINAFLGEPELLPVETDTTTSTVFEVKYGDTRTCRIVFKPEINLDGSISASTSLEIPETEISTYPLKSSNPDNEKEIEFINIQLPNLLLHSGATIIESPGFDQLFPEHPEVDAICFVLDTKSLVSKAEMEGLQKFLRVQERLQDALPALFFVQTKIDDAETTYQENRERNLDIISKSLAVPKAHLNYFPVSSVLKAKADAEDNPAALEASGFQQVLDFFQGTQMAKEDKLARKLLNSIVSVTQETLHPYIMIQRRTLDIKATAETQRIKDHKALVDGSFTEWQTKTYPKATRDFEDGVQTLTRSIDYELRNALDYGPNNAIVVPIIRELEKQKHKTRQLTAMVDDIHTKCVEVCEKVANGILDKYAEKYVGLRTEMVEKLKISVDRSLPDPTTMPNIVPEIKGTSIKRPSRFELVRTVGYGAMFGSFISFGNPFIMPISMAISAGFALKTFNESSMEKSLAQIKAHLCDVVRLIQTSALQQFNHSVHEYKISTRDTLEAGVEKMKEEIVLQKSIVEHDENSDNMKLALSRQETQVQKLLTNAKHVLAPYRKTQVHHQVAEHLRDIAGVISKDGHILIDDESFETGLDLSMQARQLLDTADRIAQGNLQVVVIGVTCHGKTTLMNALVGAELLPTDTEVNTGAIVRIVHGEDTDAATLVEKGVSRTVSRSAFRDFIQIDAETQGSVIDEDPFPLPERLLDLDYGILPHDNVLTRQGITLVDTLGFNAGGKAERVTEQFLAEADAVLVLLRAQPPITQKDVELILPRLRGFDTSEKVENMFFVVNDFGDVSPASRKRIIEDILPRRLGPLFGNNRDLFSKRVFFVNAQAALEAQLSEASYQKTGLPQFEQTLAKIVGTGEHTRLALQSAMSNLLLPTRDEIQKRLTERKALFETRLEDLEAAIPTFTSQSEVLAKEVERIRFVFETAIENIANKAAAHFENYIDTRLAAWPDTWDEARERGELEVGGLSLVKSFFSKKKRAELQEELQKPIKAFFDETFKEWGEALSEHLAPDMEAMGKRLEVEVTDFFVDLDAALPTFAVEGDEIYNPRERSGRKAVQMVLGALMLDPNQLIGPLRSDSWLSTLRRLVVDSLAVILVGLVGAMLLGPAGWTVGLAVAVAELIFNAWRDKSIFDRALKNRIGRVLSEKFQEVQPEIRQRIKAEIVKFLKPGTDRLDQSLRAEIEAVKHQLEIAVAARRAGQEALDIAKAQLDAIDKYLRGKFAIIERIVNPRDTSPPQ